MNCRISILFALAVWLCLSCSTSAQQNKTVYAEYDYVTKVNVGEDNHLYISVKGNFKPSHPCNNRAFVKSKFPLSDDRTKAWLQIATASFLSRSKVHIWTRECAGNLVIAGPVGSGYPIMVKMQMFQ